MIDDLPPLREVVARHGLDARKALGQNFLYDLNLTSRIARAAGPLEGVTIVEVGPGPGGLTRALLAHGAERVIVIERDPRCLPALEEISARYPGRLVIVEGDALTIDLVELVHAHGAAKDASGALRNARICANLPYNVATALLGGWLEAEPWPSVFDRYVLMFQREVAERIVAFNQVGIETFMLQYQPFEAEMRRFAAEVMPRVRALTGVVQPRTLTAAPTR